MYDFGYCIWLLPEQENWHLPDKGFLTHITIYKNLSYFDAIRLFLTIERTLNHINTSEDGFHALQYPVAYSKLNNDEKPIWWPNDAHISLKYQYDSEITDTRVETLSKSCKFEKFAIMKCNGHYNEWMRLF